MKNWNDYIEYDSSSGVFTWKQSPRKGIFIGDLAGRVSDQGYLQIQLQGKMQYAHRLAWFLHYGNWPENQIDHINRDKLDNRIENLRDISHRSNNQNKSTFKGGVYWRKREQVWYAQISKNNKRIYLGSYGSKEEAQKAYQIASTEVDSIE